MNPEDHKRDRRSLHARLTLLAFGVIVAAYLATITAAVLTR